MIVNALIRTICIPLALGLALVLSEPAAARVIINENTKYYTVSGKNGAEIYKQISAKGPRIRNKKGHYVATANISYKITNTKGYAWNKQCLIDSIDVVINVTYTIPKWVPGKGASPQLKSSWKSFIDSVWRHEKRHVAIAKDSAYELWRALKRVKGDLRMDCKDMAAPLKKRAEQVWKNYERKQERFDNSKYGDGGQTFGTHERLIHTQ